MGTPLPLSSSISRNLPEQLLRIINTSRASATAVPTPQSAERTPGLDAFTFDYAVEWPLSLVPPKELQPQPSPSPSL